MFEKRIYNLMRSTAAAVTVLGALWSCQTDEGAIPTQDEQIIDNHFVSEGMTRLGRTLENPHTLANMRKAYQSLQTSGRVTEDIEIRATDLYVRFLPANHEEYELLHDDTARLFFDFPLDYEVEEYGSYYHDPEIPDSLPTWQYAVWPIGDELPPVHYEILDTAFLPENYEAGDQGRTLMTPDFLDLLEEESYILTGNLERDVPNAKNCKDFRPDGYVTVEGIPINGVQVVATNFLSNRSDYTDEFGHYHISKKFKRSVKMHVKWQRYHFDVTNGGVPVSHVDKEECRNWSVDFAKGTVQAYYAHIFRAAHHYYYLDIAGLRRPPLNGTFKFNMELQARFSDDGGSHNQNRRYAAGWIHIERWGESGRTIYGTTTHELAHASHWNMDRSRFEDTEKRVKESWARGVQWVLTDMIHSGYKPAYARLNYTGIVQDFIDGTGVTKTTSFYYDFRLEEYVLGTTRSYIDNVSGYTIRQIEDALKGQTTWNKWRDNIKNRYNNATENNLDDSFAYWNTK